MIPPSRRLSPYKLLSRELPPDAAAPRYAETLREAHESTLEQNAGELLRLVRRPPGRGEVDAARVKAIGGQLAQAGSLLDQESVSRAISMARAWTRADGWQVYGRSPQIVQAVMVAAASAMLKTIRENLAAQAPVQASA